MVGILLAALLLSQPSVAHSRVRSSLSDCGTPNRDWVCRTNGKVSYWLNDSDGPQPSLPVAGRAKLLPPLSTVRTEPGAEANVRFRRKAACELGSLRTPTQIRTRVGRESLFQQSLGSSFCYSLDGSFAPIGFFCEVTAPCPAVFRSNGTFDARGPLGGGASASNTSKRRVVITACTGSYELRIFNGENTEVERDNGFGPTRTRIVIEEEETTGEGTFSRSFGYTVSSVSAPGICGGSA